MYLVADNSLKSAFAVLAISRARVLGMSAEQSDFTHPDKEEGYVFPHPGGPHRIQLPTPSPASIRALSRLPGPTISA